MRKVVLLAALLAVLVAVALPAFGDKGHDDGKDYHKGNRGGGDDPALSQESEQDAESGDVNQSFNVSNRDNNIKPARRHTGGCKYRQRLEPDERHPVRL